MDNKLLYALAPDGATHTYDGGYRKVEGDACYFLEGGEWRSTAGYRHREYEPIPARELELNRLADLLIEWPLSVIQAKVRLGGPGFYLRNGFILIDDGGMMGYIKKEQWQARRSLRIEHGLILEPAPEIQLPKVFSLAPMPPVKPPKKPDNQWHYPWDSAPDWANYAATNKNGTKHWYCVKPNVREPFDYWIEGGRHEQIPHDEVVNFRESLQRRPTKTEGVKDVIEKPKPQWTPEVGEECEFNHPEFSRYVRCEIIGTFRGNFICAPDGGGFYGADVSQFRPIKTERERFVSVYKKDFGQTLGIMKDGGHDIYDWLTESGVDLSPLLEKGD